MLVPVFPHYYKGLNKNANDDRQDHGYKSNRIHGIFEQIKTLAIVPGKVKRINIRCSHDKTCKKYPIAKLVKMIDQIAKD